MDTKTLEYPECDCGLSSRWVWGVTEIKPCGVKKFTCVYCLSHVAPGSDEAKCLYGIDA